MIVVVVLEFEEWRIFPLALQVRDICGEGEWGVEGSGTGLSGPPGSRCAHERLCVK